MSPAGVFFLQAFTIILLPYVLWRGLGRRSLMPLVVMQILCGILLGPSGLGQIAPELWQAAFTGPSLTALSGLAWLAVVLFAFLTGLHLDLGELRQSGRSLAVISLSSILVPAILGTLTGYGMALVYPAELGAAATPWSFALAVGICLGVTALPVLGAILREAGLLGSRIGNQALAAAAFNDGMLWVMLALLLTVIVQGTAGVVGALLVPLLGALYLAAMLLIVRPFLARRLTGPAAFGDGGIVLIIGTLIASALMTELIGLHYILGGFVAGVVMPQGVRHAVVERLEPMTIIVLLPFFFMLTGVKTEIPAGSEALAGLFLVATLAAVAGKVLGTALPAYWTGESWHHSLTLGVLMQTKGLMEVVVLTVLLDAGILSPTSFTALLLMALVTTALTGPLLRVLLALKPSTETA